MSATSKCKERLEKRYKQYTEDSEAGQTAMREQLWGGFKDAVLGYAAGVASSYAADLINQVIEKTGIKDVATAAFTSLAMLLTIGPQMYLALFAVCTDFIKRQTLTRIDVATETKMLLDIMLAIFEELFLIPNIKGNLLIRIGKASGELKKADRSLGRLAEIQAQGAAFSTNQYKSAIDFVGGAVDILGGGDGKGRPQGQAGGISNLIGADYLETSKGIRAGKGNPIGEREAIRLKALYKKIEEYAKLGGTAFLAVILRTISLLEVINSAKSYLTSTNGLEDGAQISYRGKIINVSSDRSGLVGLSTSIRLSIDGLEQLDKFLGGEGNWKSFELLIQQVINELLREKEIIKNVYNEMDDIVAKQNKLKAAAMSVQWSVELEALWQMGQTGGPVGAVAEDMAELEDQITAYKELKEYLSSDIDWTRGYQALSELVIKSAIGILSAPFKVMSGGNLLEPYNQLIRMREIVAYGIIKDQELVEKIDRFDGDTPLIKEAKELLKKLKGSTGAALAAGDASAFLGKVSEYAAQAGSIVAVGEQLADLGCVFRTSRPGINAPDADDDEDKVVEDSYEVSKNEKKATDAGESPPPEIELADATKNSNDDLKATAEEQQATNDFFASLGPDRVWN